MFFFKKKLGLIGFLIPFVGICISCFYLYFFDISLQPLGDLSLLLWVSTMALGKEINKEKSKKWWINTILITSLVISFVIILVRFL
jgi:hypothetical protein